MLDTLPENDLEQLAHHLFDTESLLVLTGAGISVPSGIPEYRDNAGNWKHSKPVQYQELISSTRIYRRYWARSSIGWGNMGQAEPNSAHLALAQLEQLGHVDCLITQNVDRLHERAGHTNVINLHGQLSTVSCLNCDYKIDRNSLQFEIEQMNAAWIGEHCQIDYQQKPDGDAEINDEQYVDFTPPCCPQCTGKIKPDVVFFGENIPAKTSARVRQAQADASALLVVGSSLMVFSGFRIARDFYHRGLPLWLLNPGTTRADDLATQKYPYDASQVLPRIVSLST